MYYMCMKCLQVAFLIALVLFAAAAPAMASDCGCNPDLQTCLYPQTSTTGQMTAAAAIVMILALIFSL